MPSARVSSQPRDWNCSSWSSCIASRFFTTEPQRKPQLILYPYSISGSSQILSFAFSVHSLSLANKPSASNKNPCLEKRDIVPIIVLPSTFLIFFSVIHSLKYKLFLINQINGTCLPRNLSADYWSQMCVCVHAQLCLTLCNPMDCSPPGSSIHGIFQAGTLEWVAISFSRGSSWSRDWTHVSWVSALAGGFFTTSTTWEEISLLTTGFK